MAKAPKRAPKQSDDVLSPEGLLRLLSSAPHPLRRDELLRAGALPRRAKRQIEGLLYELAEQGRIARTPSGGWASADRLKSLTGRYFVQGRGAAFVTPDAPPRSRASVQDIFIHPAQAGEAMHGDRVRVLLLPGARGKNPEGRVVEILERTLREVTVKMLNRLGEAYLCKGADPRHDTFFRVDASALPAAPRRDDLLAVTPGERLASDLWAAKAQRSFGREEDAAVQERLVKLNHQAPADFPPRALEEAAALPADPLPDDWKGREDLTGLPFVTIDGITARDFDDAIFVERAGRGFCLRVAVADVSHYVRPGSALDKEAALRGNSWYFPLSVEPMLPHALSNGLCSLNPGAARLVLATEIIFDAKGLPGKTRFYPAVIRSAARLTYEGTQVWLDAADAPAAPAVSIGASDIVPPAAHDSLKNAAALAALLAAQREERGALDFELPEPEYEFDTEGRLAGIRRRQRLFSHRIIEECMIAANEAAARFLRERGVPVPYRVHPPPDPERLTALFRSLRAMEWAQALPRFPSARDIPVLLRAARGSPQEFVAGRLCLRAMMQAVYQPENEGHFGLASGAYCHSTSPIRRYADILVHRALAYALGMFAGPLIAGGKLVATADRLNRCERAAVEAEREISRRFAVLLLADRVGEEFEAVIASVLEFGFFAEFTTMPVEGMVRLMDLTDDFYDFDPDRRCLTGRATGRSFRLGQRLRVVLTEVHKGRLEITLLPADGPQGRKKTGRPPAPKRGKTPRRARSQGGRRA